MRNSDSNRDSELERKSERIRTLYICNRKSAFHPRRPWTGKNVVIPLNEYRFGLFKYQKIDICLSFVSFFFFIFYFCVYLFFFLVSFGWVFRDRESRVWMVHRTCSWKNRHRTEWKIGVSYWYIYFHNGTKKDIGPLVPF